MASTGKMEHNPNLGSQVTGWSSVGENVGFGPSELSVHTALMNSPGHRANILNTGYAQVGVGVVVRNGRVWVTEVFRTPAGRLAQQLEEGRLRADDLPGRTGRPPAGERRRQWAAAGYPGPVSSPTEYVHYPWSTQVWAVTYWSDGWQWDRLKYAQWAAARLPAARGPPAGSRAAQIWKHAGSNTLYLTEPTAWHPRPHIRRVGGHRIPGRRRALIDLLRRRPGSHSAGTVPARSVVYADRRRGRACATAGRAG